MEVTACFLRKYFTLLTTNSEQAKDLYAPTAIISYTVNGEAKNSVADIFANGVVTIDSYKISSSNDSIVISVTGFVNNNNVDITFTQQVTLFCVAKHWHIAAELMNVTVPEPEPMPVVVPPQPEEEKPVVKAPTPQKAAPATKPKDLAPAEIAEKPTTPAPAPKPTTHASSWAALASAPSTGEKPKVTLKTDVIAKPVVATTPVAKAQIQGIYFPFTPTYNNVRFDRNEHTLEQEVTSQILKLGFEKTEITRVKAQSSKNGPGYNVFVDFLTTSDPIPKLADRLEIFGQIIKTVQPQKPK